VRGEGAGGKGVGCWATREPEAGWEEEPRAKHGSMAGRKEGEEV
jgi:hypothetical protein